MITLSQTIIQQLADQHRIVLSPWRALILARRSTFFLGRRERRWNKLPESVSDINAILRQMQGRGEIEPIPKHRGFYRITTPYARQVPLDEQELLFELFPYAVMSHVSALIFHGLSVQRAHGFTLTRPRGPYGYLIPLGTQIEEWEGLALPTSSHAKAVLNEPVTWQTIAPDRFWGFAEYQPREIPVRVTTPERTLIDGLMKPDLCGGIGVVLEAWSLAAEIIDVGSLVAQVDRFGVKVLAQRVGFIMDQLGLSHSRLDAWRGQAQRGGSAKLVASAPFDSRYDERWNLSINTAIHALE